MLANFLESLYNKVIVNIVVKHTSTDIYIELCSKKGTISSEQKSYDSLFLTKEMIEFISSEIKESPYYYISVLDLSSRQGAFPTCAKNRISYYYDVSESEHRCHDDGWTFYTSKIDLYAIEKTYAKVGVDFVFSPFSLISNFFKDKIHSNGAMYILIQESSLALTIFDNGRLLFAEYMDIDKEQEDDEDINVQELDEGEELDIDIGIDLEEIDVIDDLDDFGDIEDLDSLEDIDQFSDSQDVEEEFYEENMELSEEGVDDSHNEEYKTFTLIQSSVGKYYADEKYEGSFVETVYIADSIGKSVELKRYLEEEMFLNVYMRHIDIASELSSVTKLELGI